MARTIKHVYHLFMIFMLTSSCQQVEKERSRFSWSDYNSNEVVLVSKTDRLNALSDSIFKSIKLPENDEYYLMNIELNPKKDIYFFEYRIKSYSDKYLLVAYSLKEKRILSHMYPNRA